MSLEEEVAQLKEKKRELERLTIIILFVFWNNAPTPRGFTYTTAFVNFYRMLSPSYDTRKKLGETSDESCIASEVQKEYYRYFQGLLHGVALRRMETTEKEALRRQTCKLFLV